MTFPVNRDAIDFSGVTEVPGNKISAEAYDMMCTRYWLASEICSGKDVLEVGCGAGQGLGCLAHRAKSVVGGDYTHNLLRVAHGYYGGGMPLVCLDAHKLPFRAAAFDAILLYEAIYYLARPELFLQECRRVLRDQGLVLVCTVNPEWSDFNPSPFNTRYFSAAELLDLLQRSGFSAELRAAFPASTNTVGARMVSLAQRTAINLHLVPKTMKRKQFLNRIFLGKLVPTPAEVPYDRDEHYATLETVPGNAHVPGFKVLYALGHRKQDRASMQ